MRIALEGKRDIDLSEEELGEKKKKELEQKLNMSCLWRSAHEAKLRGYIK